MDIAFVLDFSGSLDNVLNVTIALTREVIQGLPFSFGRTRVSVVSFSDTATLHFDLAEYQSKQEVLAALSFGCVAILLYENAYVVITVSQYVADSDTALR